MQYTTKRVEVTRGIVREQEGRVARQRNKVALAISNRQPADDLQARLLIMEQSLISMSRFLKILERDLDEELGIHKCQTQKRIKDPRKALRSQTIEEAADEFASRATASILTPDENVEGLDALAKALRLSGRH